MKRALLLPALLVLHVSRPGRCECVRFSDRSPSQLQLSNSSSSSHSWEGPECRCRGDNLTHIPANLGSDLHRLTVAEASVSAIGTDSLQPYKAELRDLILMNLRSLERIEPGSFRNLIKLQTIYIYQAPELKFLSRDLFNVSLPMLKALRIVRTGLTHFPVLGALKSSNILSTVDLENNHIQKVPTGGITVKAEEVILTYNQISSVDARAFDGSEIAKLNLKGNRKLTYLHPEAFVGLVHLRHLDLSETSIKSLPTTGLKELDVLVLESTSSLKVFPSIYNFEYIKEARLTYPYHCCAFSFPATHHPGEHARHQDFLSKMKRRCANATVQASTSSTSDLDQSEDESWGRRRRHMEVSGFELSLHAGQSSWSAEHNLGNVSSSEMNRNISEQEENAAGWGWHSGAIEPVLPNTHQPEDGMFHQEGVSVRPGTRLTALCGDLAKNYKEVRCEPAPDAFSPCEDLMGNWGLRCAVWFVAGAAITGNMTVLSVLLARRLTVPRFLMCHLAAADLAMGLYLLMLAAMDARSIGSYFNYAIDWQNGAGCKVAGFLTVFACELSVFTLTLLTAERWYTITYAIHINRRLRLSTAAKIMAVGWLYAVSMAALPLLGVSGYYKTSICLPLQNRDSADTAYLGTLLVFNAIAFVAICACYARMYCAIRGGQDGVAALARSDMTVAKRMALLVLTDLCCWAPIAFFGLTALLGKPLIDVTHTKFLLVFFYPLNACANPYLYALLTRQFRRDVLVLLSRYGICSKRAARYKMGDSAVQRSDKGVLYGDYGNSMTGSSAGRGRLAGGRGSVLTTFTSVDGAINPGSATGRNSMLGPLSELGVTANIGDMAGAMELLPVKSLSEAHPETCNRGCCTVALL